MTALTLCIVAEVTKADFFFGEPMSLGSTVNSSASDYGNCFAADDLEMYFTSERSGGFGSGDIWVSTRENTDDPWGPPANLGAPVNGPYSESYPSLSSDGLTMYFSDAYSSSPRPGGVGGGDIWMTTRLSHDAPWSEPVNLGAPINSSDLDMSPTISGDDLTLVFTSRNRPGGNGSWDLWISTRASVQDPWGSPVNLGSSLNSGNWDGESGISRDGLALFYGTGRTGLAGAADIWMSTRRTPASEWAVGVSLSSVVNSGSNDGTARLSADMRTLYFCSDRPGGLGSYDLFKLPIISLVDFNGDGKAGIEDLVRLIESWGQSDPAMDIGPGPWGDGVIDAADLEVFMSQWGQTVDDPTLVAHWPFDETDGAVVADNVGGNDGYALGDPSWQPDGGQVGGALEFDALDDFISAPTVLNPADGPFSVLVWVKGGGPGQGIISGSGGSDWLSLNPLTGGLMTDLKASGRGAAPLLSQAVIADGNWHQIALVRDGSYRTLYVDGIAVAEDTQDNLEGSASGLFIGCGDPTQLGTFFSGLIDDVRIYNRAVKP